MPRSGWFLFDRKSSAKRAATIDIVIETRATKIPKRHFSISQKVVKNTIVQLPPF